AWGLQVDPVATELAGQVGWMREALAGRREEAAHHEAVQRADRVRRRHVDDAGTPAGAAGDLPERRRPQVAGAGEARRIIPVGREPPEREDAVGARVPAGRERGPCGERERGDRRAQRPPAPSGHEPGQVRQAAGPRPRLEHAPRRAAGGATIVRAPHGGLSAARNAGLAAAHGEWIAFHDADDVALPDRLAFQLDLLRAHPAYEAVFCNGERMDGAPPERPYVVPSAIVRRCLNRRLTAVELFAGYPVYFQGALVPRRAFEAAGPFDPSLRVQPDIEYGYRLFARCAATFVDRAVFRYRRHDTNNSGDRLGGRQDIARILERLLVQDPEAVRTIG